MTELNTVPKFSLTYEPSNIEKAVLETSEKRVEFLRKVFSKSIFNAKEVMILVLLDKLERTMGYMILGEGTEDRVIFEIKDIMRAVWETKADGFFIAHNHPSPSMKYPSEADDDTTFEVLKFATYFDAEFYDHIILTENDYYSYSDSSIIWKLR